MVSEKKSCVILLVAILLLVTGRIWATTLNVPSSSYPNIQAAIDAAADGDLIEVGDGKYVGPLDIQIDSNDPDNPSTLTLHSNPGAIVKGCITVVDTAVEIDGFDIRKDSSSPDNGIVLQRAHGSVIRNCMVRGFPEHGILIEETDDVLVVDNAITGCAVGIGCSDSYDVTITHNSIAENTDFGVFNDDSGLVDARENWWSDSSGPTSEEGQGIGDAVSSNVNFEPWESPLDEPTVFITRAYVTGFSHNHTIYRGDPVTYHINYVIEGGSDYAKYKVIGKANSKFSDYYQCDRKKETVRRQSFVGKGVHVMTLTKNVPRCADVRTKGVSFAGVGYEMDGYYVDISYRIQIKDLGRVKLDTDGWIEEEVFLVKKRP